MLKNCDIIKIGKKELFSQTPAELEEIIMKFKKLISAITSLALSVSVFTGLGSSKPEKTITANAASTYYKFDFGNGGVASGYTGVSASTGYDAGRGYGFSAGTNVADVSASGSGALSDAVQFKNSSSTGSYTFCADVPNGLYQVSVWLGNTNRTSVAIEGMYQIMNMTGNNAYHTLQVPITDGQLNICACEGKAGYAFTMSALEIKQISSDPTMKPTIWLCGDSTVCNYYPLDSSAQAGWGQMLPDYIDTGKWEVRNMATSGQFAKGFLDAGQFTPIEKYGKDGDIFVISIGINDTNYSNATEYHDVVTNMAKRAMAKGMRVLLVKQQGRNGDCQRNPLLTGRWFGAELDKVGSELNIEVVDLFNMWQSYCLTKSADEVSAMYMTDGLHPNRSGASVLAQFMSEALAVREQGDVMDEAADYMFKNVNSGLYMEVADGTAAAGTNVQQWGADSPAAHNTWHVKASSDGYYYILSNLGDENTYFLDVDYGKTANGTNIGIYTDTGADAQLFKFLKNDDGSYRIATKVSNDKSVVEVKSALTTNGANVQEWESNGENCQRWIAEKVTYPVPVVTEAPTTQPPATQPPTEAMKIVLGDADCDGAVSINDVISVLIHVANPANSKLTANGRSNADVYQRGDGISVNDATFIQMFLASMITFDDIVIEQPPEPTEPPTEAPTEAPSPQIYYAVDASWENGVTETTNSGYKGTAYINLDNNTTSNITFTVNAPQKGNYLVTIRNANGSANDRKMRVDVNSNSEYWVQPFLTTGAWTTWLDRGIVLPLEQGVNTIKFSSLTSEGGPNFDYIIVELTDEPIAEPYDPSQGGGNITTDNPVLYIASDSTAQSYRESYAPQQGWGYYLGNYFTENVSVANHAIAGRSSKSFYDNGRLQTILDQIKPGDYLLVDFGINDGASSQPERYAPVCGNADNPTNGSFEYYMTFYIKGALEKGATPILMSPTLSIKNASQPFSAGYRNIDSACRMLASKYNIPYFDLSAAMANDFNKRDYNTVRRYYMGGVTDGGTDFTHFTETGANIVAGIIANGIKGLNTDLSKCVK